MTEEEKIRERDAKYPRDVHLPTHAKDRRWLLRELERVKKDLVICRKSKSVYDYSDKMSERVKAEVNHLLKEKVKRLEQQLAEARKDTERARKELEECMQSKGMTCQHHPDYRPEKGDPSTIVTIAAPSGLGFLEPRERPCGLCWMARAEWLEDRIETIRGHSKTVDIIAEGTEGERDQLRELLVEAMVEECSKNRDVAEDALEGMRCGYPVMPDAQGQWPPWFNSAARLIFQMRKGE